ncbi:hypothetical protein MPSEU_000711500 [Mayamaea pseudoterrestris]|nr:hypothetical protein MPSEU_000711500 [Mayamaea pseudoterrestris]
MTDQDFNNSQQQSLEAEYSPLDALPPNHVREGDHVVLVFADGRHIFAQALHRAKGKTPPVKIFKRSYSTHELIGLSYGTVLELTLNGLQALPDDQDLIPDYLEPSKNGEDNDEETEGEANQDSNEEDTSTLKRDNRHLLDTNTSQALGYQELQTMREQGTEGSVIVSKIIANSSTFDQKTDYSRHKYIVRKQIKYQPRCRLVKCTSASICTTLHLRDPKRVMNMREDTLAQILGYANISAGCQVLVLENCSGILTGALAQRMAGYGKILTVYSGQQPAWNEMLGKYNLSFAETNSIKWVHSGDVLGSGESEEALAASEAERIDRDKLEWPCLLQDHTRVYMKTMKTEKEKRNFLYKRAGRFARKLTRHTPTEGAEWLNAQQSDSLVIAANEFIEPLTECFRAVQQKALAINLRLSNTWAREYQILPGRTHPNMNMSQSGGFILTGVKLDPTHGSNELDEEVLKEIRAEIGGRRGKKTSKANESTNSNGESQARAAKRAKN